MFTMKNSLAVIFFVVSFTSSLKAETDFRQELANGAVLVDVRSVDEFDEGHLATAVNVPHHLIRTGIRLVAQPTQAIILYCESGERAKIAQKALKEVGYRRVYNLGGMEEAHLKLGLPMMLPEDGEGEMAGEGAEGVIPTEKGPPEAKKLPNSKPSSSPKAKEIPKATNSSKP